MSVREDAIEAGYQAVDILRADAETFVDAVTPIIVAGEERGLGQDTGFLDAEGQEIHAGDLVRFPVTKPFSQVHGSWAEKRIVFRNGVWLAEYWGSEKGQILPIGYSVTELAEYRQSESNEWHFRQADEYRTVTGTIQ